MVDYAVMKRHTEDFMALWRSKKPTIAKVHGHAVAGGSDIALCCDLLVMADDAKIGYMPTRVWGCPTTAMWTFRLGPARAKQMMFTGDLITGAQAAEWGLANIAVPAAELDARLRQARAPDRRRAALAPGDAQARRQPGHADAGLEQAQTLATVFDGVTRHNPEGVWFRRQAQLDGFKSAVEWRDSGRPIPEATRRARLVAELERKLAEAKRGALTGASVDVGDAELELLGRQPEPAQVVAKQRFQRAGQRSADSAVPSRSRLATSMYSAVQADTSGRRSLSNAPKNLPRLEFISCSISRSIAR
jgi:enoyl-CoA hydratase